MAENRRSLSGNFWFVSFFDWSKNCDNDKGNNKQNNNCNVNSQKNPSESRKLLKEIKKLIKFTKNRNQ